MRHCFGVILLMFTTCTCYAQELNKRDSLKLKNILDGRDIINPDAVKEIKIL